jgi:hypothetical protein
LKFAVRLERFAQYGDRVFVERVAFAAVPSYARVSAEAVAVVRARLLGEPPSLQTRLDAAFRALEERRPAVAAFVAEELAGVEEPGVQAVAYFLAMLVVGAFDEQFGARLGAIELADLNQALTALIADGEVRGAGVAGGFYSEDAITLGQPAVMRLVREEIDRAAADAPDASVSPTLDAFYQSVLVLVIALTQAVAPRDRYSS